MTTIERIMWEMTQWQRFLDRGGDPTVAATGWFE